MAINITKALSLIAKSENKFLRVSSKGKNLFPFAERSSLTKASGELSEDGMIFCHANKYKPTSDGVILTSKSKKVGPRDSIHGAVNHYVTPHSGGNWDKCDYAILMPMKAVRRVENNNFVGGSATDFYSHGNIRIPEGSIIVRHSKKVPKGEYHIRDASSINDFKDTKGILLIDTCEKNMRLTADNIIQRSGYTLRTTKSPYIWGDETDGIDFFKLFKDFLTQNNMKTTFHTNTPNGCLEQIINFINVRGRNAMPWKIADCEGNVYNYKEMFNYLINYSKLISERPEFRLDFNTKKLMEIINTSKNPRQAMLRIEKEMKIKVDPNDIGCYDEELCLYDFSTRVGCGEERLSIDDKIYDYIKHPNLGNLRRFDKSI